MVLVMLDASCMDGIFIIQLKDLSNLAAEIGCLLWLTSQMMQ
jgi:hypothetical protein